MSLQVYQNCYDNATDATALVPLSYYDTSELTMYLTAIVTVPLVLIVFIIVIHVYKNNHLINNRDWIKLHISEDIYNIHSFTREERDMEYAKLCAHEDAFRHIAMNV